VVLAAVVLTMGGCATNQKNLEQATHDGLVLVPKTRLAEVYMKPGADLSQYQDVGLVDCQVSFRKNWERDQNSSTMDLSSRVTQKDVDRIKGQMAAACNQAFAAALLEEPAYKLVDKINEGAPVLLLRPSIINLDINAPDLRTAGMSRSYTTSAGEMTLFLELLDGTTGDIIARAIDKIRDNSSGTLQWSNSVSNKAEADRAMQRWAKLLRQGLDEARAVKPSP
jgi:hypothetical protein